MNLFPDWRSPVAFKRPFGVFWVPNKLVVSCQYIAIFLDYFQNKVPEHHLSSTTICTEPEPSQNTSSTISTPSSPELLRACHSTLPSPRWSITLEPSPTEKPRRPTFDIAEGGSESRSGRRTQPSQGLQLRRVKTLHYSPRAAVAQIRRAHSEGCVSWETCGCTGCSRKDDGMALNARAQSSCCSLVISNPCSCVPPTSRSAISTTVVETVLTGAVVTDAFSGGTENEAVHTTTETNRIAFLTLRRKALIDELSRLHLELLDSLRAEWLLTRVFPEGFEDLQDYIIDPNPRLKSTSFPLVHLLQHSNLNGSNNRAQMECPEPSGGGEIEAAGTFEPSDCQGDLLMREISSSSALIGSSSFKGSLQSFASTTTSQLWIGSVAGTTEMMTQSIEYEPKLQSSRTSNWSECGLTALSQLEQRLARLEEDYAVVSQIYKVHRQRASETHWTAYRSAYKCNAQKLRELSKEMEQLRREIKMAVSTSQDPLQRSDSLSTSQTSAGFTADPNEAAAAVTLPRRRPFRPPPCIRRHTMAQPRAGANSWWTLKRRMGSRPTLPTAPPSMFTSICDGAMTLSAAGTPTADETTEFNKPDNYGSLGRKKRIQAQGRTRLSLISLAFRFPLRTLPKNRSLTAQPSDRSSVDTLANADSLRSPSESRVVPGPEDMKNDETPKPRLRGSKWRTYRKPTLRLLPFTRAEQGEDCHLRRSRSYPDARGWNYPVFFQSSRTESSALVTSKTLDPLDDFKYASPVTDLLRTDFPDEANSASTEQVNPLKVRNQTSCHPPPQQFAKAVFVAASPSLRSSSGCYSFSSQASSQLSSLALSTSCGHSSAVMVRPETGASTPPRSPLVEVPSNDVVHLRRPARTLPARAVAAPSAAANAPIRDSEAANGASCQAFCPATNSIRCICSCISEVETADALRNCSCLDITVPDGPSPEDIHSCSTMTPVPQHRPPAFLNGCDDDERSIDIPDFLKSRQEKGRSCTLPGNRGGGSNRSSRKLENGISVRRSFNPLAIFRLGLARGQSTEDAVTVLEPTMVVKSATLTANSASKTPPVESPVPVTKPRQSFWQRARQSLLPSAATNSPRWHK
ncbi:unnamed protein product [Schistocephalus solidus]|uniref:Uncharacterized protein n=1 Tax=Schistocephalus solidus TaxID=70667 RepID=A0A183SMY5_SCHSO|nr:unnamed protein product [Schistocephalus solidus]